MKLLLLIPLIFCTISLKAQTATVVKDGERLFDKDVRERNIKTEIYQKQQELDAIVTRLNLSKSVYDWGNYATWDSKERLNEQIAINEKKAYTYDKNPAIFTLCNKIETLNAQLEEGSKLFDGACKKHTYNRQQARKNSDNAKARIEQLNGIVKKEAQDKNTHQAEMNLLDKELQEVTNNSKNLSAQLDAINNRNTSTSLDDFLASNNNNTSNDFLADPSSNNDDFLSGSSKGSSNDFLSETNHSTDFKITSKDGLTGVVNAKGDILIPFKEWVIVEYKMGIAKVSTVVAKKSFSAGDCVGSAYAEVTKMGFVNSLGDYINGSSLKSYVGWQGKGCLRLVSNNANNNISWEQIQRNKARAKREDEYKKEQAKNEAQQWALNYIR